MTIFHDDLQLIEYAHTATGYSRQLSKKVDSETLGYNISTQICILMVET